MRRGHTGEREWGLLLAPGADARVHGLRFAHVLRVFDGGWSM